MSSSIVDLLAKMRGRLGMYLGTPSLTRLAAYLRGYQHALEEHGRGQADPFLPEFRDWIHRRFQTTEHSWEDTIVHHSADERDAMNRFWQLLDAYCAEHVGLPVVPPPGPPTHSEANQARIEAAK